MNAISVQSVLCGTETLKAGVFAGPDIKEDEFVNSMTVCQKQNFFSFDRCYFVLFFFYYV